MTSNDSQSTTKMSLTMSLTETTSLITESQKIVDAGNDNNATVLNMILQIVTNIESKMSIMEKNIDKRLTDLNDKISNVTTRVRKVEIDNEDLCKKLPEESCQCVSNLFDKINGQVKLNTGNVIKHDSRIKQIEDKQANGHSDIHNTLHQRIKSLERQVAVGSGRLSSNCDNETIKKIQESVEDAVP